MSDHHEHLEREFSLRITQVPWDRLHGAHSRTSWLPAALRQLLLEDGPDKLTHRVAREVEHQDWVYQPTCHVVWLMLPWLHPETRVGNLIPVLEVLTPVARAAANMLRHHGEDVPTPSSDRPHLSAGELLPEFTTELADDIYIEESAEDAEKNPFREWTLRTQTLLEAAIRPTMGLLEHHDEVVVWLANDLLGVLGDPLD